MPSYWLKWETVQLTGDSFEGSEDAAARLQLINYDYD